MQLKGRQMISQGPNTGIGLSAHIYSSKKRTQLWQLAWVIKLPFSFLGRLENCETLWQSLQGGANLVLPSGVLRGPRYITTFDNKVSFKHATHRSHQKGLSLAFQDMQISKIYLWALLKDNLLFLLIKCRTNKNSWRLEDLLAEQ